MYLRHKSKKLRKNSNVAGKKRREKTVISQRHPEERAQKRYRVCTSRANGRRPKETLIYKRWRDMRSRTLGRATRTPHLYEGLELGWKTFAEFREWALANGFSKENNSPDRIDAGKGYVPGNVRFVPPYENTFSALDDYNHWRARERCAAADNSDVPF